MRIGFALPRSKHRPSTCYSLFFVILNSPLDLLDRGAWVFSAGDRASELPGEDQVEAMPGRGGGRLLKKSTFRPLVVGCRRLR